jgi:hypothetical protein
MNVNSRAATQQQGFTITQMVITLAIIAVVSVFGVLGIKTARAQFRWHNSARLFAAYIEKARVDSIRRHAAAGAESSIETFEIGSNTYAVTMDFGSGTVETRTFQLDSGLSFHTDARKVTFDWRGRIAGAWVFQIHSDYLNDNLPVDVSGSGDITVGEQHFPDQSIPEVTISQVTGDVDSATPSPTVAVLPSPEVTPSPYPTESASPSPTATASPTPTNGNGNGNGNAGTNNGNGNGNATPTPTPTTTPTPTATATPTPTPIPQCVSSISPSTLSLSQSNTNNQTGSATFTISNGTGVRTISASQAGNGNSLILGISLVRIDGNGSSVITVTTKRGAGNRGTFIVNVSASPSCGSTQQLKVSVSN